MAHSEVQCEIRGCVTIHVTSTMVSDMSGPPDEFHGFLEIVRAKQPELEALIRNTLETLCEKGRIANRGFDRKELALQLILVNVVPFAKAAGWKPERDLLRYGKDAHEVLKFRDLDRIAKCAQELRQAVPRLRLTNLVYYLHLTGQIPAGDFLSLQFSENGTLVLHDPVALNVLAELPALGSQAKGEYLMGSDSRLWALCRYVKRTTGGWNDALVVKILEPLGVPHCESADALKMWRTRLSKK